MIWGVKHYFWKHPYICWDSPEISIFSRFWHHPNMGHWGWWPNSKYSTSTPGWGKRMRSCFIESIKYFHNYPPPKANMTFKKSTIWRCISYWECGLSNVIWVFRGVSLNFNVWSSFQFTHFHRGLLPSILAGREGVQVRRQSTGIWSWLRGWRCPEFRVIGWLEFGHI